MKTSKKDQKTKQAILDSLAIIFEKLSVEDALKVEAYALATDYFAVDIPTVAPELFIGRANKKESPVDFVRRVYGDYLGRGLVKVDLKRLDKSLYCNLNTWKTQNGAYPDDFYLPTRTEMATQQLEDLKSIKSPSIEGATTSWEEIGGHFANMKQNARRRQSLNK